MTYELNILKDDRKLIKYIETCFPNIKIDVIDGNVSIYKNTNIKKIIPIIYKIKSSKIKLMILYFKCDEIKDNKYYIPKIKEEFNLLELKNYLNKTL